MASTGVTGARELVAAFTEGAAQTELLMPAVVTKCAGDLIAEIQKRASGPPGPRAPTGDYRGSWAPPLPILGTAETFSLSVGTDRPQAARLEYGFGGTDAADTQGLHTNASGEAGVDSIGRHYDQQPLPHWGPANDVIEPVFHAAMEAVAAKAVPW